MRYEEFKEKGWLAPVSAVRNGEWTDGRIIETLWDYREDEVNPSPGKIPMIVVVSFNKQLSEIITRADNFDREQLEGYDAHCDFEVYRVPVGGSCNQIMLN
jgi:hypothetical protein